MGEDKGKVDKTEDEPLDIRIGGTAVPGQGGLPPWIDLVPNPIEPPDAWTNHKKSKKKEKGSGEDDAPPQLIRTVNLLPAPAHGIKSPASLDAIADFLRSRARQGLADIFLHPDYARQSGPMEAWARAIAEHQTGIPYTQPAYFYDGGQQEVTNTLVTKGRYPLAGQCQQSVSAALAIGGWDGGKYGDIGSGIDAQPYCASLGQGFLKVPMVLEDFSDELWASITVGSCLFWSAPCPMTKNGVTCGGGIHALGCGKGSGHVAMVIRKHPTARKWQLWDTCTSFIDPVTHEAAEPGARLLWESHWWDWIPKTLSGGSWSFRGIGRINGLGQVRAGLRPRGRARLILRKRSNKKLLLRSSWISMEKEGLPITWLLRSLRGAPFWEEIEPTWCINSARDVPSENAPDNRPLLDLTCDEKGYARMSWKPKLGLHNRPHIPEWLPEEPYPESVPQKPLPLPAPPAPLPGQKPEGPLKSALLGKDPLLQQIAAGYGWLVSGARGEPVKALQLGFITIGDVVPGGADGVFGPGTAQVVKRFQSDRGLVPDGIVGRSTVRALDDALVALKK